MLTIIGPHGVQDKNRIGGGVAFAVALGIFQSFDFFSLLHNFVFIRVCFTIMYYMQIFSSPENILTKFYLKHHCGRQKGFVKIRARSDSSSGWHGN